MAPEEATVNSDLVSLRNMKDAPIVEVDDDVNAYVELEKKS